MLTHRKVSASTSSMNPSSGPVGRHRNVVRKRSRPSARHSLSIIRSSWRVSKSCRKSSPTLNITRIGLPVASAFRNANRIGAVLELNTPHASTSIPDASNPNDRQGNNKNYRHPTHDIPGFNGRRKLFGSVLASSARRSRANG